MSVYIKGMEMPKSCGFCPIKHLTQDGDACYLGAKVTEYQQRPDDGPLIPVPDHGRLIDADALLNSVTTKYGWFEVDNEDVRNDPTIIPAEEVGEC